MNLSPRLVLRVVGAAAVLFAVLGIALNVLTMSRVFFAASFATERPFFHAAFVCMNLVCLGCFAFLIVFGVSLLLGRETAARPLAAVLLFEIGYFVLIGVCWHLPLVGGDIAAATGIANGGLMYQFLILFPLWAPLCLSWASRRLQNELPKETLVG